jgi:hypothetical protein
MKSEKITSSVQCSSGYWKCGTCSVNSTLQPTCLLSPSHWCLHACFHPAMFCCSMESHLFLQVTFTIGNKHCVTWGIHCPLGKELIACQAYWSSAGDFKNSLRQITQSINPSANKQYNMQDSGGTCFIMCPHMISPVNFILHRLMTTFCTFFHSMVLYFQNGKLGLAVHT